MYEAETVCSMVTPPVYIDTLDWAAALSPWALLVHFCPVPPHTAFRVVTAKVEAIVLRVIRAHSKNSDNYQQEGSQTTCQRKGEIHNRKYILGTLLERRVFSFLCIYWIEKVITKHRFRMSAERSHQRTAWKQQWNKIVAFETTSTDAIVCSDHLFSRQKLSCHTCRGACECDAPILTLILLQSIVGFIFSWNRDTWN